MNHKSSIVNDLSRIEWRFRLSAEAVPAGWAKKLGATVINLQNLKFSAANVTMFVHTSILRRIAFKFHAPGSR
jgi:hypothetical protein